MEISPRRMTSVFKDCCRLLSCLLVFFFWPCLSVGLPVCDWRACWGSDGHDSLSQSEDPRWHTPSLSAILPHSLHRGMGKTGAATSVRCVETKDNSWQRSCAIRQSTRRGVGWHEYAHISPHTHVFVVLSVLLSRSVCGSRWRQTRY